MISQRIANLVGAVLLVAIAIYFAIVANGFQTNPFAESLIPAKFFPLLMMCGVIAFTVLYAVEYLIFGQSGKDKDDTFFESFGGLSKSLLVVVVAIAAYWIWRQKMFTMPIVELKVPAFAVAGIMLPLAASFAMGNRNMVQFAIILVSTVCIFLAFHYGLNVRFG